MTSVHAHNAYAIALKSRLHCRICYVCTLIISMCMHVRNVMFKCKQRSDQKIFLYIILKMIVVREQALHLHLGCRLLVTI